MIATGTDRAGRCVALARNRFHDELLDRDTGQCLTLVEFLGGADYGEVIDRKRVALENELLEGRARYACPWCEEPMVLRSIPTKDRTEQRFYLKHHRDTGECSGIRGLSAQAICARKFAHAQEGAQHKRFKELIVQSLDSDFAFSNTCTEARWMDVDGVRWRQPDVQSVLNEQRVAFEVQLSTTFLHVIAERMTFYRHNDGRLLWLFRDLDPTQFRLSEDDLFYSNNRNGFRVSEATAARSRQQGRFALECVWHEPIWAEGRLTDIVQRRVVAFDELRFDVSAAGAPRAYFFDYDQALLELQRDALRQAECTQDQALRDEFEAAIVRWSHDTDGDELWLSLRGRFRLRGFDLPRRLYTPKGPFYLLQAAYSAKLGRPVACRVANLMGLANNLFHRHKETLWVFAVVLGHYQRGRALAAHGDVDGWKTRRDEYRQAWLSRNEAFKPERNFDDLLAFLFPECSDMLLMSPANPQAQRLARQIAKGAKPTSMCTTVEKGSVEFSPRPFPARPA